MSKLSENVIMGWIGTSLTRKVGAGLVAMLMLMLVAIGGVFLLVRQQQGDATVVNVAGRQRMLSQRIANRTLRAINGEAQAIEELQAAVDLFDRSLKGLRDGDPELGLPPAPAAVRPQLDVVDQTWQPTYQNVQMVLQAAAAGGQIQALAISLGDRSEELLSVSAAAVTELESADASPSAINVAGRQRMLLSQRMARLALQISQGETEVAPQLDEAAQLFDRSLLALLDGDDTQGFPPATGKVRERLLEVQQVWQPFHTDIQTLVSAADGYGEGLKAAGAVVGNSEPLLKESNQAVVLFEQVAQSKVTRMERFLAGVAVAFLVIFMVVLWLTRRAVGPVEEMAVAAGQIATVELAQLEAALQAVAGGDLTQAVTLEAREIEVDSADEVGRLARAFNQMEQRLQEAGEAFNMTVTNLHCLHEESIAWAAELERRVEERTAELAASEACYRTLFNSGSDAIYVHGLTGEGPGKFIEVNDVVCQRLGYTREELLRLSPSDISAPETADTPQIVEQLLAEKHLIFEAIHTTKDGREIPVEINARLFDLDGQLMVMSVSRDITERVQAEVEQRKLSRAVEHAANAVMITDRQGNIEYVNPAFERITGYSREEALGQTPHILNSGKQDAAFFREMWQTILAGEVWHGSIINRRKSGELYHEEMTIAPVFDPTGAVVNFIAIKQDISERVRAEEQIQASLREKEVLLKEIHHRVKNNLQIISSLLSLQSRCIQDEQTLELFKDTQSRVRSMALIHEKLYQSENLTMIDFAEYVQSLAAYLLRSYGIRSSEVVELKIDVDHVSLSVDTAVSCGLIINELVSNSLKHAFPSEEERPAGKGGEICIRLRSGDDKRMTLIVGDNGVGLPNDLDWRNTDSMGLGLVNTLVEQLEGTIDLCGSHGTEYRIEFPA